MWPLKFIFELLFLLVAIAPFPAEDWEGSSVLTLFGFAALGVVVLVRDVFLLLWMNEDAPIRARRKTSAVLAAIGVCIAAWRTHEFLSAVLSVRPVRSGVVVERRCARTRASTPEQRSGASSLAEPLERRS